MPGSVAPSFDEISDFLSADTSPDSIVARGWFNRVHGRIVVGEAMYERSKTARRFGLRPSQFS